MRRLRHVVTWGVAALGVMALVGGARLTAQGGPVARLYYLLSAATTNATVVTGCAPTALAGVELFNLGTTPRYVRFYNTCTTPSETNTPVLVLPIPGVPASTAATLGQTSFTPVTPARFPVGLSFRITNAADVADTGPAAAGEVIVNLVYY